MRALLAIWGSNISLLWSIHYSTPRWGISSWISNLGLGQLFLQLCCQDDDPNQHLAVHNPGVRRSSSGAPYSVQLSECLQTTFSEQWHTAKTIMWQAHTVVWLHHFKGFTQWLLCSHNSMCTTHTIVCVVLTRLVHWRVESTHVCVGSTYNMWPAHEKVCEYCGNEITQFFVC